MPTPRRQEESVLAAARAVGSADAGVERFAHATVRRTRSSSAAARDGEELTAKATRALEAGDVVRTEAPGGPGTARA